LQRTWVCNYKFTELDYTPHVQGKGRCMFHGELRNVIIRDVPEGVGFSHFLTDDPRLTVSARISYTMKLDIARQRFAEEVELDSEELRKQYPSLRKNVEEFEAVNGRKPNAREMYEMAKWDELADAAVKAPKLLVDERRKIVGDDRRALKWYEAEVSFWTTSRTAMYRRIADKTRTVRQGGRQEWEEFEPPLHPCNGAVWDRMEGQFIDGWITGDTTLYFRDASIYRGPYVHYCPAHVVDPGCLLTGAISKIHLFNAQSCAGNDLSRYAPGRTPQPKCQRKTTHWGIWQDGPSRVEYQGCSVDNHFAPGAANGILVVQYPDGSRYSGGMHDGELPSATPVLYVV
jgi:hypothetical protein